MPIIQFVVWAVAAVVASVVLQPAAAAAAADDVDLRISCTTQVHKETSECGGWH